jgi:hypothetical protein
MTDIVTFPCEYLVIDTGYTGRLLSPDKIIDFNTFCSEKGVIPLFVYDTVHGTGELQIITVRNGTINENAVPTDQERQLCQDLLNRLNRNNLGDGIIVFRVGSFSNATETFLNIGDLDYCYMGSMDGMKFLRNQQGIIDMAYVSFDCESG